MKHDEGRLSHAETGEGGRAGLGHSSGVSVVESGKPRGSLVSFCLICSFGMTELSLSLS